MFAKERIMKSSSAPFILTAAVTASLALTGLPQRAHASTWAGANANWSSNANPGWNGTGVPDAIGATALFVSPTATTTQDIGAGVTVGTLNKGGAANASWTIVPTNALILNQDGGGAGYATLANSTTAVGGHRLNINAGTLTLADDLLISNTSGSNSTSGSIAIAANIGGAGNITLANISNNIGVAPIYFNGTISSNFTGNILLRSGAVTFNDKDFLGNAATNVLTLGQVGQGGVSLVSTNTPGTVVNNIVVTANTGGATLLGSISNAASNNTTFSGTVTLNGNLTLTSANITNAYVALSNTVSGAGSLTKVGAGIARLSGVNTYTGDTLVNEGTLLFTNTGEQYFLIQDSNESNQIAGAGTALIDGLFRLDTSLLNDSAGLWNLVDVNNLTETFGVTFGLAFVGGPAFTNEGGGLFTSGDWTFNTATGDLTLAAIPEPGTMALFVVALGFLAPRRRIES
jgi:autotransporter-associated beta strand protein